MIFDYHCNVPFFKVYGHMDRARAAGLDPHAVISHNRPAKRHHQQAREKDNNNGGGSSRRPSVSLAIAKVTNDSEDGGLSIEFTTKQVCNLQRGSRNLPFKLFDIIVCSNAALFHLWGK